jgi:hypothetical protein
LRLARRPEHPRLAHNNSAISRLSTRPPPGRPRSTLDSGRATNKGLGTAPEYEHDHRREPADARTAPQAATTSTTTNQTMAINPYPLTSAPPYGRHSGRPDSSVRASHGAFGFAQQQSSDPPRRGRLLRHGSDRVPDRRARRCSSAWRTCRRRPANDAARTRAETRAGHAGGPAPSCISPRRRAARLVLLRPETWPAADAAHCSLILSR